MANLLKTGDSTLTRQAPRLDYYAGSILLYVSMAIFFLVVGSFGSLLFINNAQRSRTASLIVSIQAKEKDLRKDVDDIFLLEQKLNNLRLLLANHSYTGKVFTLLERNVHPRVRFSSFSLEVPKRSMTMSAEAPNYTTLARQIALFQRDPQVERVEFGGLSSSAAGVNFKLTVIFTPEVLKK